jgi:Uma2 family endonuclease
MPMLIDERHLPATLTTGPMTDEQFADLCAEHEDLRFEMTADGELLIQPLPYNLTAKREQKLYLQLEAWAATDGRGYASGANEWFVLPNGARRAPDAAWVLKSKVAQLPPESLERFWHLCPDFVAEIKSPTDRLPVLRAKMEEWIRNGAQLGWLIDPERRVVEIYRPGAEVSLLAPVDTLAGEPPVLQFVLDLRPLWDPLQSVSEPNT